MANSMWQPIKKAASFAGNSLLTKTGASASFA
jgi:hypothetical protein